MAVRWTLLVLALHLILTKAQPTDKECPLGFAGNDTECHDEDECIEYEDEAPICGENAQCLNTNGSFDCVCEEGFRLAAKTLCKNINECNEDKSICGEGATCHDSSPFYACVCNAGFVSSNGKETFRKTDNVTCEDRDECQTEDTCGPNAACFNTLGSHYCKCENGFKLRSGHERFSQPLEQCHDVCVIDKTICGNGTCHRGDHGHYCACHAGFTNYGNNESRCTELNCDVFKDIADLPENARDLAVRLQSSCVELTESESLVHIDGDFILQRLLALVDKILSDGVLTDGKKISTFLDLVENTLKLIGPFIRPPGNKFSSSLTEMDTLVHIGDAKQEYATLSTIKAGLKMDFQTAAGDSSLYPGFTFASILSYANMEAFADGYFDGIEAANNEILKMNSKVMTVTVSNRDTSRLEKPVLLKFDHLIQSNETHMCVFWNSSENGGTWSRHGCQVMVNNSAYTVCSCNHLSSFAVLMSLVEVEDRLELRLITWIGLSLSLACLFVCILTFSLIRSIQSPRTTIHLHLCVNLFVAILVFLVGIARTENKVGCAVIAGLLHYFYLAAFCWMCLEGVQLFRMVVLVFNTHFKTLYMLAGGYGVPAVIVAVSAATNPKGYGTERYCWLSLDFIWSFFGPVCVIIAINIFFFLITVWKLAQKFSSLNPELGKLQKIRTFLITAVAQLCLLGGMWIFGCFQFTKGSIVMSYLFTIFGSLQGFLLFAMHCLLSKQVTDEYKNCLCSPRQKKYSHFSYASKAHASKSSQDTGESQI